MHSRVIADHQVRVAVPIQIRGVGGGHRENVPSNGWITWTNVATTATLTIQSSPSPFYEAEWVDYVKVPVNGEELL